MSLLIDEGNQSFSPDVLAQFDTYQENHPDICIAMVNCAPEEGKRRLSEKQFLARFFKAVARYYSDDSTSELISALKYELDRRGDVIPVFVNPQLLCTKESGRSGAYSSIGPMVTTIRHIWDHSNTPMIFCCNEGFMEAVNADEAGTSFKWRSGMWMETSDLKYAKTTRLLSE